MKIEILSDRAVSPNLDAGNRQLACAFPLAARLADGRAAVLYRQGTTKHSQDGVLAWQTSSDQGVTWSPPQVIFNALNHEPPQTVVSGGICQTARGTLFASFSVMEGLPPGVYMFSPEAAKLRTKVLTLRSENGGKTWSRPTPVDTTDYPRVGITTKGFALPDGTLYVPIETQLPNGAQATAATVSVDDGRTFAPLSLIAGDHSGQLALCDARFTTLKDGRLLMLLWTFVVQSEETIAVHRSVSADGGKTWSAPVPTNLQGQITQPLALPSGTVIAASNFRHQPEGSRLWVSHDDGQTWDERHIFHMWDPARQRMVAEPVAQVIKMAQQDNIWEALAKFTFGTPDLVDLGDGTILLTYYATLNDIIHIRACRLRVLEA